MNQGMRQAQMKRRQRTILLTLLVIAGASATVALASLYYFPPCTLGAYPSTVHFTIIESITGYNNSKNQAAPWPLMTVHCGQQVTIHLQNIETSEAHGFKITFYHENEVILGPGEAFDVTFTVTKLGDFKVQCTILCIPHIYMLYGQVTVIQ